MRLYFYRNLFLLIKEKLKEAFMYFPMHPVLSDMYTLLAHGGKLATNGYWSIYST